jgi:hypothetical protein
VFQSSAIRFVRESAVLNLPGKPTQARALKASLAKEVSAEESAKTVRGFLEDYFKKANLKAGLPEPKIFPDCDANHVGLTVSGLRGQVLADGKSWEKIQIELELVNEPAGLLLTANIDGSYAGGLRFAGLPSDYPQNMDHDHPTELKEFSNALFDKIKQSLMKGAP